MLLAYVYIYLGLPSYLVHPDMFKLLVILFVVFIELFHYSNLCDGLFNCPTNDDEQNCPTTLPPTPNTGLTSPGKVTRNPPSTRSTRRPRSCDGYLCHAPDDPKYCIKKW